MQHGDRLGQPTGPVADEGTEEDPVAVIGTGRELPPPSEDVAAVDRVRHSVRDVRRGDPGVGIVAPHLFLQPPVHERHLPGVNAPDAAHPPGRSARFRHRHDGLGEVARMGRVAAVLRRLEQAHDAGLANDPHALVGEPAERFRLAGHLAQPIGEFFDATYHLVDHGRRLARALPDPPAALPVNGSGTTGCGASPNPAGRSPPGTFRRPRAGSPRAAHRS